MLTAEQLTRVDELLDKLVHAAAVLTESIADPVAIADAPLNHRASALAAVGRVMRVLARLKADAAEQADDHARDDIEEIITLDIPDEYIPEYDWRDLPAATPTDAAVDQRAAAGD
jgi:hypothetical protein